jgi:hypothetical protein
VSGGGGSAASWSNGKGAARSPLAVGTTAPLRYGDLSDAGDAEAVEEVGRVGVRVQVLDLEVVIDVVIEEECSR